MEKVKCPEVRFKGFTDAWKQFRLGELCSEFRSGEFIKAENIAPSGDYPVYGGNGLRGYTDTYNHDGDFALIGRQGALCGNMQFSCGKAFFTEHAVAVKANNSNDTSFLYHQFGTMNLGQYSGQSAQPGLAVGNLIEIETLVPDKTEQTQIGNFFQNLDQSITLHEKKLTQTQNLKKAMLEKMFPKAGCKQPEIRLKGFSGEWEQRELGEYCDMSNGDRGINYPNADDMVAVGIPFINAGDLQNGKVNLQYANKITRDKYNQLNGAKIQLGDIVYCLRGTLGKNAYIDNFTEGTVASSLVVIRPKNIIGSYLFQILNSDIEYRQRTLCDEGAAQPNLSARNLAGFLIPIPSLEEQKEIGNFFKQLDETIVLQRQQLQTLKNLKQAFGEKMFV
ncbi:restriction endonuclease subunit S [Acinetobacter calcoaceticus]|uniref:restriction endonuclease subunit S n=1 Tax=Acinetobacter calcoaceticus TaxID=471 RepID=UPI002866C8D4|nr:restriction endonuclease subunit S [Acinetobacter calcoaceticus]MDR6797685.1 type I restriction enzyme S subunit [Acinetobacter calcoaceticus]